MTPPNYRDHRIYLVHLLRVLHRRGASPPGDLYDEVADLAGVTPEQRAIPGKELGWNPVYRNRIQFARQALVDAGLVVGSTDPGWRRGIWELSPAGVQLVRTGQSDATLDAQIRERAAEGLSRRRKERQESFALAGLESESPEEFREPESGLAAETDPDGPTVQDLVEVENDAVLRTMLDHVRGMSDRVLSISWGLCSRQRYERNQSRSPSAHATAASTACCTSTRWACGWRCLKRSVTQRGMWLVDRWWMHSQLRQGGTVLRILSL